MKKVFFYTFLYLFLIISVTTVLGIIGIFPDIKEKYLDKLFYSLIISLVSTVILLFKRTDFFLESNPKIKNRISKAYGFEYGTYLLEDTLSYNGSTKSIVEADIKCTKGELKSRIHEITSYCDQSIENLKIDFKADSDDSNRIIDYEIKKSEKNIVSFRINFSPSLKEGDCAKYRISTESQGLYKMYFEDIVEGIKNGTHFCNMPVECHGLITSSPINNLTIRMNLPKDYKIIDSEFYDVFPGTSYERSESEFEYLKKNKAFNFKNTNSEFVSLELNVTKPVIGLTYVVKWRPPKKNKIAP